MLSLLVFIYFICQKGNSTNVNIASLQANYLNMRKLDMQHTGTHQTSTTQLRYLGQDQFSHYYTTDVHNKNHKFL